MKNISKWIILKLSICLFCLMMVTFDVGNVIADSLDMDNDNDVDGYELSIFAEGNTNIDINSMAKNFGTTCPIDDIRWLPKPGTSWQWQLTGNIDTTVKADAYDIDYLEDNAKEVILKLKQKGRKVICYFSAGSYEDWRPDAATFPKDVLGKTNGWPGEKWLDIRQIDKLGPIMKARLDQAKASGCDAVEPDNVDGYSNNTGFSISASDQVEYNKWLAEQAHQRGMSIALKNSVELAEELEPFFDFAINEECFTYNECDSLQVFTKAGKAVLGAEYELGKSAFCGEANRMNMDFIRKNLDLDAWRDSCR